MTRLRMRVADRLKGAQNTYAMLTTFNEIDMTGLMQLRSDYKVRSRAVSCTCPASVR
jgi:2-oxoglutarate dehydrogenase E2 component (dihydrolipoamide succinyltransferase)